MKETQVWPLGQGDTPEKEMATHYKSHGQRILAGYSPWGRKEKDMTEQLNNNILYTILHSLNI